MVLICLLFNFNGMVKICIIMVFNMIINKLLLNFDNIWVYYVNVYVKDERFWVYFLLLF